MFNELLDYTVNSTDEEHYNRINCNLPTTLQTKYCKMTVTSLTTNGDLIVLEKDDYIMINGKQYSLGNDYTNLDRVTFSSLLEKVFNEANVDIHLSFDDANRLLIYSSEKFVVDRATYNMTLLTGLYNTSFPIYAEYKEGDYDSKYYVRANSVGFTMSTPVLYLVCNVGIQSYRNMNKTNEIAGAKIVMRLNNSFMPGQPIIVVNADFMTTIMTNDLSNLQYTLVDANMKEIKLLTPMYITIQIIAVPDTDVISDAYSFITNGEKQK